MCCLLLNRFTNCNLWKTLLLGQFLSFLITTTGISSQYVQNIYSMHVPTAQSFLTYCLLCLIFTTWLACKPRNKGILHVMKVRGWKYILLSLVDVEANYLLVKAFQFTTLTSIQLLDCLTIPIVLTLSWIFIRVRYGLFHILGSCVALIGVGCLVWSDIEDVIIDSQAKNRFLGDMLCMLGAALYGISNVAEEYIVKCYSIVEFLGMIGFFGSIFNGIQLYFLEKDEILSAINTQKWHELSLIIGFSMSLLLVYITMPLVLQVSSATAVNLSLLSSDFYSLIIGIYLFQYKYHWLYIVSFSLVISGLIIYSLEPTPKQSAATEATTTVETTYKSNIASIGDMTSDHHGFGGSTSTFAASDTASNALCAYNAYTASQLDFHTTVTDTQNIYLTNHICAVSVHASDDSDPNLDIIKLNGNVKYY